MMRVWTGNKWVLARSEPKEIRRGKKKGKFKVQIQNPKDPKTMKQIIVDRSSLKEVSSGYINADLSPVKVSENLLSKVNTLQQKAKAAVKFGNGLKQTHLFKKAEQRSLF